MARAARTATTGATRNATTCDPSGTVRGQIEFSLNLLRIASPGERAGEPASERASDVGSARTHITALEELLDRVDPN
jgi:hypothetical protein